MKKLIFGLTLLSLVAVFVIVGVTCMIVSFFVEGYLSMVLSVIGYYGIGAAIGGTLFAIGSILIIMWYEEK